MSGAVDEFNRFYETKKELKDDAIGRRATDVIRFIGLERFKGDGEYIVCGPDPHRNRVWWATIYVNEGRVAKVT